MSQRFEVDPASRDLANSVSGIGTVCGQFNNAVTFFLSYFGVKVWRKVLPSVDSVLEACNGPVDGVLCQAVYENV